MNINKYIVIFFVFFFSSSNLLYAQSSTILNITDNSSNSLFFIKDNGHIGINNTSPRTSLHIDNDTPFNLTSSIFEQDAIYLNDTGGTAGAGNYGASIGFSKVGTSSNTSRRAAIAAYQNGTDIDNIGLAFFVHGSEADSNLIEQLKINSTGVFLSNGNIQLTSDRRFKKNINSIENSLNKVLLLEGVTFNWRSSEFKNRSFSNDNQIGFIAQEVEKVIPEIVHTDYDGFKSVAYSNITALLVEAIKEQQVQITLKNERIKNLEERIQRIESLLITDDNPVVSSDL